MRFPQDLFKDVPSAKLQPMDFSLDKKRCPGGRAPRGGGHLSLGQTPFRGPGDKQSYECFIRLNVYSFFHAEDTIRHNIK